MLGVVAVVLVTSIPFAKIVKGFEGSKQVFFYCWISSMVVNRCTYKEGRQKRENIGLQEGDKKL